MQTQDFDFFLPEKLIAQYPTEQRSASRLLLLGENIGDYQDAHFYDLPQYINQNDLLIFNDTRVIKARLFGKKASGGAAEVLIERILDEHRALAHVRASRAPKPGSMIELSGNLQAEMIERHDDLFELYFHHEQPLAALLEKFGQLPLPPYISHDPDRVDETRYQTVYAKHAGAVAAPTAGLHFDHATLQQLADKGVRMAYITLHVGAGTFQPVKVDNIQDHKMHSEHYVIPEETAHLIAETRKRGGKIIAIGTTALRALESAAQTDCTIVACSGETSIFITPGYQFKIVDKLLTNFHLPKSTLLMLVSAFAGFAQIKHAYQHAVANHYRFFSYGDAMLLERKTN